MKLSKESSTTLNDHHYTSELIATDLILSSKFQWMWLIGIALVLIFLYPIISGQSMINGLDGFAAATIIYGFIGLAMALFILNLLKSIIHRVTISESSILINWYGFIPKRVSVTKTDVLDIELIKSPRGKASIYANMADGKSIKLLQLGHIKEESKLALNQLILELKKIIITTR